MRTLITLSVLLGLLAALEASVTPNHEETNFQSLPLMSEVPFGERSFEVCQRPEGSSESSYTCNKPDGIIVQEDKANMITYKVDIGTLSSLAIFVSGPELPTLSSICYFEIDKKYTDNSAFREKNFIVVDTDATITIMTYRCNGSPIKLAYYTFSKDFNQTITTIEDTTGTIEAPPDENGYFGYQPRLQQLWILNLTDRASKIDLTLVSVDLGAKREFIHDESRVGVSDGDFLLIGSGPDILGGQEVMFYGRQDKSKHVSIASDVAHIFFYSDYNFFNTTGFEIYYNSTDPEATKPPVITTTTESPPPPVALDTNTFVALNGLPPSQAVSSVPSFRSATAVMATKYAEANGIKLAGDNVTNKMVQVLQIATCNMFHCDADCAAYNFSVGALDPEGNWVFTGDVLDDMLTKMDVSSYYDGWQVCDERPTFYSWEYTLTSVLIVVFSIGLILAVWRLSKQNRRKDSEEAYEEQQRQKRDEMRRRSSGNISMIGIGGSVSSRGSLGSRRFTMPFPKANNPEDDELELDFAGYKEYDPDLGRVDPQEFGLQSDFVRDPNAVRYYSNDAFVDDEGPDTTIYQRGQVQGQDTDLPGTDSEDSDGGAVSFSSFKKKKPVTHFTFPAEVHDLNESGETAL